MNVDELIEEGQKLLSTHNLGGWIVKVEDIGQLLGQCDYKKQTIVVGDYYLHNNPTDMVRDTLRHEVAHALTPGHNHDAVWRAMAAMLGAVPRACYKNAKMPLGKFVASCPKCTRVYSKNRLHYKDGYYCKDCGKDHGILKFSTT